MKKLYWFLLCLLVLIVSCDRQASEYKIGVIYNLEGSQSSLDIPSAQGAECAIDVINSHGGIHGKKLKIVIYDGKSDPAVIREATGKLIHKDKVPVIIGFSDTDMVLASAPIAAENGVIFITSGATSPKLPEQVPEYLFLSCFGDNVQAAVLAEYAYLRLGLHSCYVLTDENMDFTRLLSKYFIDRYSGLGGKIIHESFFQGGENNIDGIIQEFKTLDHQPEMLFISAGPDNVGDIVLQLRKAGINQPIFGGDSYDTSLLVETAGKYATDIYFATHFMIGEYTDDVYFTSPSVYDQEQSEQAILQFISAYKEKYGILPTSSFSALGYDAVMLVADMYERVSNLEPAELLDTLSHMQNFSGVTGTLSYNDGQRIPQKGVTLIKVQNGDLVFLESVVPTKVPNP